MSICSMAQIPMNASRVLRGQLEVEAKVLPDVTQVIHPAAMGHGCRNPIMELPDATQLSVGVTI